PGSHVRRGEPLMTIEAMKMEHTVAAPADGVVEEGRFAVGDLVEEGAALIVLAAPESRTQASPGCRRGATAPPEARRGDREPRPVAPYPGGAAGEARRQLGL